MEFGNYIPLYIEKCDLNLDEKEHVKLTFYSDGKVKDTIKLRADHLLEILKRDFEKEGGQLIDFGN